MTDDDGPKRKTRLCTVLMKGFLRPGEVLMTAPRGYREGQISGVNSWPTEKITDLENTVTIESYEVHVVAVSEGRTMLDH
jgi:hypothetical protein